MTLEVCALLIAGGILIYASLNLLRIIREQPKFSLHVWLNALLWFVPAIGVFILWPEALQPSLYPRRSFLFIAVIAVFIASLANGRPVNSISSVLLRTITKSFLTIAILTSIFLALRYMILIRHRIEGVDFYFYVSLARDLVAGITDLTPIRHAYFPGVYMFWQVPFVVGMGSLESLQWWYFGLIVANAVAMAAVTMRVVRSFYASVFAALCYVSFCSRSEGFVGATEPLVTLPVFLGLFVWGGRSLLGRAGFLRCVALGAGLGLALLAKQQGGFLALGAISLIVTYFLQGEAKQVTIGRLLLLPVVSVLTFLIGFLLDGHGLQPLQRSFALMGSYGSQVNFWNTLMGHARLSWPLAPLSLFVFLLWLACLFVKRFRIVVVQPWFQILGFTCIAGYAALVPFTSRGYSHYGLLPGPMLILSVVISFVAVARYVPARFTRSSLLHLLFIILAIYPFIRMNLASRYFYLWPIDGVVLAPQELSWQRNAVISRDLNTLKAYVKKGENILVLPPRRYVVHFYLGTSSRIAVPEPPWGLPVPLAELIKSTNLDGVILINPQFRDRDDIFSCSLMQCDAANTTLEKLRFRSVLKRESMVLWKRR